MAIITNPNFDAENLKLTKRPLYLVTIEGITNPLTTFRPEDALVSWGGYGVSGYGTIGYGY